MRAGLGGWVRWMCRACAVFGTLGVAACSAVGGTSSGDGDADATSTTTEPVQLTELSPIDDHGTVDHEGRRIAGRDAAEVEVGFVFAEDPRPGPAVLRFPPIASPASCIASASLRVTIAAGGTSTPAAVYPGDPTLAAGADGEELPSWQTLLDNRPRGVFELDGETSVADVTELVRTWAAGGPFPSRGLTVDPALPVVLIVQPEAAVSSDTFRLSMSEAGAAAAPTLTITKTC